MWIERPAAEAVQAVRSGQPGQPLKRAVRPPSFSIGPNDAICPAGQSVLIGVFKKGRLHTALAARRGPHGFDRVVGPSVLRREMGLVSGDWTRDYRYLTRAAEACVGTGVCLGCFAELATLQELN